MAAGEGKMLYLVLKVVLTVLLVVVVSEVARRSTFVGALIASLPIVSILAIIWLYVDERDAAKVAALSTGIFWLVLPSLVFFVALPLLLKRQVGFTWSLVIACAATVASYFAMVFVLGKVGVKL